MLGDMRRLSMSYRFGLTLAASVMATTLAACEDPGPEHRPKADLCLDAKPWTAARKVIKRLESANSRATSLGSLSQAVFQAILRSWKSAMPTPIGNVSMS